MPLVLMRPLIFVAALLVLPAGALAFDCGDTIPAGSNVKLQKGVDFTSTTCTGTTYALTIEGPAKVDMGGIRIRGTSGTTSGILLTGSKVKLSNGGVVAFWQGLVLDDGGGHSLSNVGSTGALVNNFQILSDRNKLKDTVAAENPSLGSGYNVSGDGNKLIGVTSVGGFRGVSFNTGTTKNLVAKSFVAGASTGIRLDGSSSVVSKNVISTWTDDGIRLWPNATANKVQKNLLAGGASPGGGEGEAIHALAGSADNQITKNVAVANRALTVLEDDNASCGTNRWSKNLFTNASPSSCIE